ncbi:hypothetical protein D3C79_1011160 [compost metagenome]
MMAQAASPVMLSAVRIMSNRRSSANNSGRPSMGIPAASSTATTRKLGPGTPAWPMAPRVEVRMIAAQAPMLRSML